jgi:hypothetical protein
MNQRVMKTVLVVMTVSFFLAESRAQVRDSQAIAPPTAPASDAVIVAATPTPTSTNLNGLLKDTAGEQKGAAKTGVVLAGAFGAAAVVCWSRPDPAKPWCRALTAAAVGSALVASHNSGKSAKNNVAACEFVAGGCAGSAAGSAGSSGSTTADNGNGASGAAMTAEDTLRKTAATLQKAGVQVDYSKNEVTTPDGKTMSLNALSSPESMSLAGIDPSDLNRLKAISDKALKDNKLIPKSAEGVDSDSINVGSKSSSETTGGLAGPAGSSEARLGLSRDPAQVAGLKAMLNGEPIGVAADSIFGIIDRRYELHHKQGSFLLSQ